ncbi:MAG: KEOPS complex subunit Pcc1 [Candidatus Bathyarchaeia archaeon]
MIREAHAILRLEFPTEKEAEIISRSIWPETESAAKYRSKVKAIRESNRIMLIFESKDMTSLRASINSYLNWIMLLRNIYGFLEDQERGMQV